MVLGLPGGDGIRQGNRNFPSGLIGKVLLRIPQIVWQILCPPFGGQGPHAREEMPHSRRISRPGSSATRSTPVANAFDGAVMGSMATASALPG